MLNTLLFLAATLVPFGILFGCYMIGHCHGYKACETAYEGLFNTCKKIINNKDKMCAECKVKRNA